MNAREEKQQPRKPGANRGKPGGSRGKPDAGGQPRDAPRAVVLELLRAVRADAAYANLLLPVLLRRRAITGRDAAFATELGYGTCRAQGLLDAVIAANCDRDLGSLDGDVLDALRLGTYQLLRTRVPQHAALSSVVELVRTSRGPGPAGLVNAILRRVTEHDEQHWLDLLAPDPGRIGDLALRTAHPRWIAQAFRDALGGDHAQTRAALEADDQRPTVHLLAKPGAITAEELAAVTGGTEATYSPYGVYLDTGGDPGELDVIRDGMAIVQDEGSQLVAHALVSAPVEGRDQRWLDLCAGPGGKAVLLGAVAQTQQGHLDAVERAEHRADLVRRSTSGLAVTVHTADALEADLGDGGLDRVLVDAPCTGLGALRRRPESRWRRSGADIAELSRLQRDLLERALQLVRPGGVVGYATCSPHLAETVSVVQAAARGSAATGAAAEQLDARPYFPGVPELGDGPHVQLWPHRHGTDAMFFALLRRG